MRFFPCSSAIKSSDARNANPTQETCKHRLQRDELKRRTVHLRLSELAHECSQGFSIALLTKFTSSERRETLPYRSSFARKLPPLFRVDRFQSSDARRSIRRSAVYPRNRPVFPRPSLESFDFH